MDTMPGMGAGMGPGTMSGPMWMPTDPPTFARLIALHPQPVPIVPALALLGLALYLYGVVTLARRGDQWPVGRTIMWVVGILVVLGVTATGVEGYGMALFSVHMAQHMALAMIAPIFLLLGSPVTLALRALPGGSVARRAVSSLISSRFARIVTSIPVRWFLFLSGLYGIYFTPIFDHLMTNVWGHNLMLLHFLVTGFLFFGPLVASDPWPTRGTPPMRMLETFASTPFHAFFGIAVMMASTPLSHYFDHRTWGIDPLSDQATGGGIAWATSEVPTVLVMAIILVQWIRSDTREARRRDRAADRDDDAELVAYNAWLAKIAAEDRRR